MPIQYAKKEEIRQLVAFAVEAVFNEALASGEHQHFTPGSFRAELTLEGKTPDGQPFQIKSVPEVDINAPVRPHGLKSEVVGGNL